MTRDLAGRETQVTLSRTLLRSGKVLQTLLRFLLMFLILLILFWGDWTYYYEGFGKPKYHFQERYSDLEKHYKRSSDSEIQLTFLILLILFWRGWAYYYHGGVGRIITLPNPSNTFKNLTQIRKSFKSVTKIQKSH